MNCQPISINTNFKWQNSPIGNWSSLSKYRPQPWNSLSKYRPLELRKNYEQLYNELNRLHDQAFWDGVFSLFNGGSTRDIDFSRIKKLFNIQRSRVYENGSNAIANAWKKVGDTLGFIMGGKQKS